MEATSLRRGIDRAGDSMEYESEKELSGEFIVVLSCRNISRHVLMGRPSSKLETMTSAKQAYVLV